MKRPLLTLAPLASLALVALCAAPALAKEGKLTGFDVIARKGRKAKLKAKLETKGFMGIDPDVKGAPLDFFVVAKNGTELKRPDFLGTEKTDNDGFATMEWTPEEEGHFDVIARLRKGAEHTAAPARIFVAVPAETKPILIVQLDETVSTATNLKLFRGTENEEIKALDGAKQSLELLSPSFQLVYLTDLEVAFTNKFKDWLALRKLPRAPVLFWELFERSLSHGTYMKKMVARLQKAFPISVGIGGKPADAEAFRENGVVPVLLADEASDEVGDEVVQARNWGEALAHTLSSQAAQILLRQYVAGENGSDALRRISLLGNPGVAYLTKLRHDRDLNLAASATLIVGKLRGIEAFKRTLDKSNADRTLNSLIAAWRFGQPAVLPSLHTDGTKPVAVPAFTGAELVSRTEPEPGKVAFKLRLKKLKGEEPFELELTMVEQEDGTWLIGS